MRGREGASITAWPGNRKLGSYQLLLQFPDSKIQYVPKEVEEKDTSKRKQWQIQHKCPLGRKYGEERI